MTFELPLSLAAYPLAGFLVYWCCLAGEPIFDDLQIVKNTSGWEWTWRHFTLSQRPITSALYALQKAWPNTMRGLHVGNVALHVSCALVVEHIARQLGFDDGLAFLAGLLYVLMPFAVNSVAYVTGRASLVSGFFGLCAVSAILAGWPWLAFPLLVLAVLSKQDGVGFAAQSLAVMVWQGQYGWALFLALYAAVGSWHYRQIILSLFHSTGDKEMAAANLPVSYPPLKNAAVVLVETLWRVPFWAFGFKQSPWHGGGVQWFWR